MKAENANTELSFAEVVSGLMAGDFSRLAPLFQTPADGSVCSILRWHGEGRFAGEPAALAEAFTCACFNGFTRVAESLLRKRVNPDGGINTGLNAFHWAANRGHLEVVELLIRSGASLETKNSYGGTVLGCAVWSAVHEPKPKHVEIVAALLNAGAQVGAAQYPSGDVRLDEMLKEYGAGK